MNKRRRYLGHRRRKLNRVCGECGGRGGCRTWCSRWDGTIRLSQRDYAALVGLLNQPPAPTQALKRLFGVASFDE